MWVRKSLEADKVHTCLLVSPNVLCKVHPGFTKHETGPALEDIHFLVTLSDSAH